MERDPDRAPTKLKQLLRLIAVKPQTGSNETIEGRRYFLSAALLVGFHCKQQCDSFVARFAPMKLKGSGGPRRPERASEVTLVKSQVDESEAGAVSVHPHDTARPQNLVKRAVIPAGLK